MNLQKQMMQMAKQMQQRMAALQEELANTEVEGTAGGGMVKAVCTGTGDLVRVEISPEVVDPEDVEMLQDLVTAAVREGLEKAKQLHAERMGQLMPPGLNLPGLF